MTETKSRAWLLPTIVGVIALLIGVGIGAAGSSGEDEKPAVKSSRGSTTADLDKRESSLDDERTELSQRTDELDVRERQLARAEQKAKANTIEGDGTFEIGVDMKPGKWKNADASDGCYWSINSDPNGNNIVANHNGGGPQTVDVNKGQYLELSNDCGTWKKVG
ncbi:MAG: hypothetical protein SHS37scaffold537_22 [Phage 68_12]|nr:MAG: hypothetical protein SHS37scaffold537_22 [Phage 68_12]